MRQGVGSPISSSPHLQPKFSYRLTKLGTLIYFYVIYNISKFRRDTLNIGPVASRCIKEWLNPVFNFHRFSTAFFVDGSSEETIKRDLVQHVRSLGSAHAQKSFKEAKQFLSLPTQERERLLVIDNADDPEVMISPLLPRWKRGTIIITSRNASHGQLGLSSHLKLDVMEKDESIELFNLGSGGTLFSDQDRESAGTVVEELGFLPIAPVQAASYINRTRCSAEAYISLLRTSQERILSDPATNQIDMRYTTAFAAFDASYSILPSDSKEMLHLLSFMHRQKFPVQSIAFDAENEFSFDSHQRQFLFTVAFS
ncbi:hypothetical protein M408DRAFT_80209 [Serendipita vermifera MAFF 305830]|uniref:NB-ARC domain-containing protein n=1 Tax=Serendipita vermifera MAFF 305830 TaxID=933852 RepID=A0A0C2W5G9_SERVB|nr:hypothetical protein M408DRAFT_80209 [Serendipita vermifera MAFF 305830]